MEDPFAGYEYVDMGLPSGILWATCNVGATSPEQAGLYFSWGNVDGHVDGDGFEGTQEEYEASHGSTLGATDNIPTTAEYDAAVANMGGGWRMPTTQEIQELFNSSYTTNTWTTLNGMNGRLVTSKANGNTLFFPAAGFFAGGFDDFGYYWSSSFGDELGAYNLIFYSVDVGPANIDFRWFGYSVRAVHAPASPSPKVVLKTEVGVANGVASLDNSGKVTSSQLPSIVGPTINKTWSELKAMRDGGTLVPGQFYRITDYTCTTTQKDTQSAGHVFDIIVRADSANVLNENAYAAKHAGDTYFTNSKLEAWRLMYCIDNDTNRFAWADSTNGKGIIYQMIDEFGNDCPYDFKNIQFKVGAKSQAGTIAGVYYYTFSVASGTNDATITDHSLNGYYCYNNRMEKIIMSSTQKLNFNVFRNTSTTNNCNSNTFGNNCYGNIFGNDCNYNFFGNNCNYNSFGDSCSDNSFGNYFQFNSFGNGCNYNFFGNNCYNNSFGNYCSDNSGNYFQFNSFGNGCNYNFFGNNCYNNSFGNYCSDNSFGNYCQHIIFSKDYCYYNIIENDNQFIMLTSTQTTSNSAKLQNIKICQGVNNAYPVKTISHNTVNNTFQTEYKPANSQVISV
jgi:hypothetical protein